ncbi:MAG: peptidase domain-containing ABC transporter, partial [Ktedonobacteraceae bacterium]|nr:peptidase domain-containing ABC transporter [Ktedonobacteraceae bacterium]
MNGMPPHQPPRSPQPSYPGQLALPAQPPQQPPTTVRQKALLSGLGVKEPEQVSPLTASVIAHRESVMRRNSMALEPLAPPEEPKPQTQEPSSPSRPGRLRHALQGLVWGVRRKRVQPLLQMSHVECGAACLAMILRYYGRRSSISDVSERAGIGRDGMSALDLVKAARSYGLRVRAISLQDNNLRYVDLPAIVYWEFNHFLIVERWLPTGVDVVDPAAGRRHLTPEEFDTGFTGVVVTLEPGVQFVRDASAPQLSLRSYTAQYLKRAPFTLLQILGASLLL